MKINIPEVKQIPQNNPTPGLLIGKDGRLSTYGEIILRLSYTEIGDGKVVVLRPSDFYRDLRVPYIADRIDLDNPEYYKPYDGPITLSNE